MKKIVIALLGTFMVLGLIATPVVATPFGEPTAIARADTYTSVQHHCYSDAYSINIQTKWATSYYIKSLTRCQNGPTGVNGGHTPIAFYVGSGWCARNYVYNNGSLSFAYNVGAGRHQLYSARHTKIKAFRC